MSDALRYEVLSSARAVSMGDEWFDVARGDHFWIERRFEVIRRLCAPVLGPDLEVAEIGCGIGLVQSQFETHLDLAVDGFDLNAAALQKNRSERGRLRSYDVHDRHPSLEARYDLTLLLDVIEHVEDDVSFLDASSFLAKPGGHLLVNVPATPSLFSRYDEAAGHLRRYTPNALLAVGRACDLEVVAWTYWGLPLLPAALARKLLVRRAEAEDVIRLGFQPPGALLNRAMGLAARLEPIPQRLFGTSLLALFRRGPTS